MSGNLFSNVKILWKHFNGKRRLQFKLMLCLMILASLADILSIGAVFPFFGALMSPEQVFKNKYGHMFFEFLNIDAPSQIILPITIVFCLVLLIASGIRILSVWLSVRFSFTIGSEISNDIYRRTLYQPYSVHISRNSSEIINGIWIKVSEVIFYILMPTMTLISSAFLVIALIVTLCLITPSSALIAIGGLIIIYAIIIKLTRQKLKSNSVDIAKESNNIVKNLQEGLSGIRDVLIDGSQKTFFETYKRTDHILRRAQGYNQIIAQIPNHLLMGLGMVLIAIIAYTLTLAGGFAKAMPSLVALTLGLQRLLPAAQLLYTAYSTITGSQASLHDVVLLLQQQYPDDIDQIRSVPLSFNRSIEIQHVSFKYGVSTPLVLNDISITIKKGHRIGFIGTTGCGKSTLIDIIMGLLEPTSGNLMVDGEIITKDNCSSWQRHIAHVPQNVFLADTTIEKNIAFGVPDELIDFERIRKAAEQAQLSTIIEGWPDKYNTRVGERGVQLSGGQCQRIGIARALYKQADLIVLDEATSALDNETEKEILSSIEALSKDITIIMIAHRLNTLTFCDEIIELGKGVVINKKTL